MCTSVSLATARGLHLWGSSSMKYMFLLYPRIPSCAVSYSKTRRRLAAPPKNDGERLTEKGKSAIPAIRGVTRRVLHARLVQL